MDRVKRLKELEEDIARPKRVLEDAELKKANRSFCKRFEKRVTLAHCLATGRISVPLRVLRVVFRPRLAEDL